MIGDFNDIVDDEEKKGGNYRTMASTRDFRDFLANNGLFDLGFKGYPFTWRNKRDDGLIQQRLDHGVATTGWMRLFLYATILHVMLEGSDHSMLVLSPHTTSLKGPRRFIYDSRWGKKPECREIIKKAWKVSVEGSLGFKVCEKLKGTRSQLGRWKKTEL